MLRYGAGGLTLNAVASEAGVSKPSVLYDYKCKQSLIKAVVDRINADDSARLERAIKELGDCRNAHIKGRIASTAEPSDDKKAVAMHLCSTLAQDDKLRASIRQSYQAQLDDILETSANPSAAMLAFLAIEGLKALEFWGILEFPAPRRNQILEDIAGLVDMPAGIVPGASSSEEPS